jgi:hypothetical protein
MIQSVQTRQKRVQFDAHFRLLGEVQVVVCRAPLENARIRHGAAKELLVPPDLFHLHRDLALG